MRKVGAALAATSLLAVAAVLPASAASTSHTTTFAPHLVLGWRAPYAPNKVRLNLQASGSQSWTAYWTPDASSTGIGLTETPSAVYAAYATGTATSPGDVMVISNSSSTGGGSWSEPANTYVRTAYAPAMTSYRGQLWVAAMSATAHVVTVLHSSDGIHWFSHTTPWASSSAVSMAVWGGELAIGFRDNSASGLVHYALTDDGAHFFLRTVGTRPYATTSGPALGLTPSGRPLIAFVSDDGHSHMVVTENTGSITAPVWHTPVVVSTTPASGRPALANWVDGSTLTTYLAFAEPQSGTKVSRVVLSTSTNGTSWTTPAAPHIAGGVTPSVSTGQGPSLAGVTVI